MQAPRRCIRSTRRRVFRRGDNFHRVTKLKRPECLKRALASFVTRAWNAARRQMPDGVEPDRDALHAERIAHRAGDGRGGTNGGASGRGFEVVGGSAMASWPGLPRSLPRRHCPASGRCIRVKEPNIAKWLRIRNSVNKQHLPAREISKPDNAGNPTGLTRFAVPRSCPARAQGAARDRYRQRTHPRMHRSADGDRCPPLRRPDRSCPGGTGSAGRSLHLQDRAKAVRLGQSARSCAAIPGL